jgi:DNA-binding MarR family transcriptional regulator
MAAIPLSRRKDVQTEPIFDAPGPRPLFLFNVVRAAMNDRFTRALKPAGITPALGEVLLVVAMAGSVSSSVVARRLGITPQSVKQSIDALEKKEMIVRTPSERDQRILTARLTAKGEQAKELCLASLDEIYIDVFGSLTTREFKTMKRILRKLVIQLHPETIELYSDRRSYFDTPGKPHGLEPG